MPAYELSEEECVLAALPLGAIITNNLWNPPINGWPNVPPGCSIQHSTNGTMYNFNKDSSYNDGGYWPICKVSVCLTIETMYQSIVFLSNEVHIRLINISSIRFYSMN